MLKELLGVLRGDDPEAEVSSEFRKMLSTAHELFVEASAIYWGKSYSPEQRTALYERDIEINRAQRRLRKRLVSQATMHAAPQPARLLVLMSLVKDVERLGDYAKNLLDISGMLERPLPDDDVCKELGEVRSGVEAVFAEVPSVLDTSDLDGARELYERGRSLTKRCDALIEQVAKSDYGAANAVGVALGARYYKRTVAHLMNLLSSVLMPVHKLDYFDERALRDER